MDARSMQVGMPVGGTENIHTAQTSLLFLHTLSVVVALHRNM